MDMKNKKVLVFGSGISGIGAGKLLEQVGASVVLYDGKETLDKEVLKAQLGDDTKAEIILGELSEEVMELLHLSTQPQPSFRLRAFLRFSPHLPF